MSGFICVEGQCEMGGLIAHNRNLEAAHRQIQATVDRLKIENEALRAALKEIAEMEIVEFGIDCNKYQREVAEVALSNQQQAPTDDVIEAQIDEDLARRDTLP